jgi:hypothetical protein
MAPIPNIEPDDVVAITAYVRSVQQTEGLEPYSPELRSGCGGAHQPHSSDRSLDR